MVQRAWEKTAPRISALTWTGLLVDQRSLASAPGLSDRSRWHVLVLGLVHPGGLTLSTPAAQVFGTLLRALVSVGGW